MKHLMWCEKSSILKHTVSQDRALVVQAGEMIQYVLIYTFERVCLMIME